MNRKSGKYTVSNEQMLGVNGTVINIEEVTTNWSIIHNNSEKTLLDKLEPDTWYTVSFDVYSSLDIKNTSIGIKKANATGNFVNDVKVNTIPKETWTKVSSTFKTLTALPEISDQYLYWYNINTIGTIKLCNLKLEKGTTATPWTPAPEDIWHSGYLDDTTGETGTSTQYPGALYSDLIRMDALMEYTYGLTDGSSVPPFRIVLYGTDGAYRKTATPSGGSYSNSRMGYARILFYNGLTDEQMENFYIKKERSIMAKFLDTDGVVYLWNKIKSLVTSGLSGKVDKVSGKGLSTNDYSTAEKSKLSGIANGAEVNQNAFSNVVVGSTTIAADGKTDTLTLTAGSNVTLTPDATNDKVTIAAKDTIYTHPTGSGYNHVPSGGVSGKILRWASDGTATWDAETVYDVFEMSKDGLVPYPGNANGGKFLRGDGTWATPTNTTYGVATTSANGLMSSTDKGRVDNLYKRIAGYAVTGGTTSAYTASITGATLTAGTMIALRFNAANAASATLNLNSLGAKPIYYNGAAVPASRCPANAVMLLVYDTTQVSTGAWHLVYSYDSNTTYSVATQSTNGLMAAADKKKLDGVAAGAEVNQNAFGIVKVGDTSAVADAKTDTLFLESSTSALKISADGDTDKITFEINGADSSNAGLMPASMFTKVDLLPTNAVLSSTYAKKTDIANMYKFKGSVAAESNLPASGQTAGDVYNIEGASTYGPAGTNVAWTGEAWDALGGLFTIDAITNAEIDSICS